MAITLDELYRADFYSWLKNKYILPTGENYNFKTFEYLEHICKHHWKPGDHIFAKKPSQVGVSEIMLALAVWMNLRGLPKWKGCGYFFPAREQLQDHIKARFLPMFDYENDRSLELRSKLGQQNLRYIALNRKPIYFRSGQTRRELISIALDCAIIDEFDEFQNPISVVPTLEARFGQSDYGFIFGGSTPTIPEIGIDAAYAMSNQYNWYAPCTRCGVKFSPVVEVLSRGFESCVVKAPISGDVGFICPNCHDLTQTNGIPGGDWILDEKKDNQNYGYAVSRLFTPRHKLNKMLEDYELGHNLQEFYNSTLGLAYAPKNARLTRSSIFECATGPEQVPTSSSESLWMGIDVGKKCHWVVGRQTEGKRVVVAYGACNFDDLNAVVSRYNVKYCVIDLRPYEQEVKRFIGGRRGFVACEFNTGHQEDWFRFLIADEDTRGEKTRMVKADKTQCCDILINEIANKHTFVFPSSVKGDNLFISQMCAPVRMEKTDKDRGDITAIYGNGGRADHYFFACSYLMLAFQLKRSASVLASKLSFF